MIPNYNRPNALARLLDGVFAAIAFADAWDRVKVVVVDDHSEADLSPVVERFSPQRNFSFLRQAEKCGNAELAFLNALDAIDTDYVWLLGNDDQIVLDGLLRVLGLLTFDAGLILLNPALASPHVARRVAPIRTTSDIVFYDRCEDLFFDFGFVTSTTTFPSLLVKVAPVRDVHRHHALPAISAVYSHTFTLFCALRDQPALMFSPPVVVFSLNDLDDERRKLDAQVGDRVLFFHQSLGLARLIRRAADLTGCTIETIGQAREDEFSKSDFRIRATRLSSFLVDHSLAQLRSQLVRGSKHRPLSASEEIELRTVIDAFRDDSLGSAFEAALSVSAARLPEIYRARRLAQLHRRLHHRVWKEARPTPDAGSELKLVGNGAAIQLRGKGLGYRDGSLDTASMEMGLPSPAVRG